MGENPSDWNELKQQLLALWQGEQDAVSVLANTAAVLYWAHHQRGWHWVGFYRVDEKGDMALGPFHGPPACVRIASGKGVCGYTQSTAQSIYVPDVHAFEGHIACSAMSQSEYVAPVVNSHGGVMWVLDVDSDKKDGLTSEDQAGLEWVARQLSELMF